MVTQVTVNKLPVMTTVPTSRSASFTRRLLTLAVQLTPDTKTNQPNTFTESGTDTVTIDGVRMSVRINHSGSPAGNQAQVKVWGLTPSLMNQLTTLGLTFNIVPNNKIIIKAGDVVNGMVTIYSGNISGAYGDYRSQPDVPFIFECQSLLWNSVAPVAVSSFPGTTDVADIMSGFARQMSLGFRNYGVTGKLSNAYYRGAVKTQADEAAADANIVWGIEKGTTMAIWPLGQGKNTQFVPMISPSTGMISYPSFTQNGIVVDTLFNPQISFGGLVKVESSLLSAIANTVSSKYVQRVAGKSGGVFPTNWLVNQLDLALDSLIPNGEWKSTVYGWNPGYPKVIPQKG